MMIMMMMNNIGAGQGGLFCGAGTSATLTRNATQMNNNEIHEGKEEEDDE